MMNIQQTYIFILPLFLIMTPVFPNHSLAQSSELYKQVKITRTEYGVPHIQAENMKAAGMGLGYVQIEDYGEFVVEELIKARGEWSAFKEIEDERLRSIAIDRDAAKKLLYQRAVETYQLLKQDTRDFLEGYAEGINLYIKKNPEKFREGINPNYSAMDLHARSIDTHQEGVVRNFIRDLQAEKSLGHSPVKKENDNVFAVTALNSTDEHPDAGSNTWAFSPERVAGRNAVLVRNPHLNWDAGYYEAHITVPGKFNFYGDFRAGNPIGTVGGFNEFLGFSTTNNYPKMEEIYALEKDKTTPDAYILDGKTHRLLKKEVEVSYKVRSDINSVFRTMWFTEYGPVIHQDSNKIYVIKSAREGEYRVYEQFLEMMKAKNLEEWKEAMRIHAKPNSNLTYADRDGNIFYVWNAKIPDLPLPSGDGGAVEVSSAQQIWSKLIPWDSLPQRLNPKGGYLHNENDPFHFTNLNEPFYAEDFPDYFPQPQLRLRSQLSLDIIAGDDVMTLEEIMDKKHDLRLMLAERVKPDLLAALADENLSEEEKEAAKLLENWDNTAAMESRGSILFVTWWDNYVSLVNNGQQVPATAASAGISAAAEQLFRQIWTADKPAATPFGLANTKKAVEAFKLAIAECNNKYGTWDLPWGKIHRARIGDQDLPVSGATGELGAFRVIWYSAHKNAPSKREVTGGDGWTIGVEFTKNGPRAYSILAYGNSILESSPNYANQLFLFVHNRMKPVFYTPDEVAVNAVVIYHPGEDIP